MNKIKVGVIAGGFSNERDVSLKTSNQIIQAIPEENYDAVLIEIPNDEKKAIPELIRQIEQEKIDVAFIGLHGRFGEDGKIQAVLKTLGIPHTGPGVLTSALGMNKAKCMEFLDIYKIVSPKFITLNDKEIESSEAIEKVKKEIGFPCVVKPNESGSSVGVSIVKKEDDLMSAIENAFNEDGIVILQKYIKGKELSCGVMGNAGQEKTVLPVIEIIAKGSEFFDYQAKYFSQTTDEICPTTIGEENEKKIRDLAKTVHEAVGADGLTRSDFIIDEDQEIYFLEVNTIPGQTEASLCPKEAKAAGISFPEFLEKQIKMALGK